MSDEILLERTRGFLAWSAVIAAAFFAFSSVFISLAYAVSSETVSFVFYLAGFSASGAILVAASRLHSLNTTSAIMAVVFLAFAIRALWAFTFPTEQTSDFNLLYNSSVSAASGDFSFSEFEYFKNWSYQLGFVAYQALVLLISDSSQLVLKLLNCAYIASSCFFVYKIAHRLFDKKSALVSSAAYALYLPTLYSSSLLTNQHLATLLFLASAWAVVGRTGYIGIVVAGVLAALGHIIRPLGPVYLLALFCLFVFSMLNHCGWRGVVKHLLFIPSFLSAYFLSLFLVTSAINMSGMHDGELTNNNPYWKFVTGLNHESGGHYSRSDNRLVSSAETVEERDALQANLIQERIEDKSALLSLFARKYGSMWGGSDGLLNWSFKGVDAGQARGIAEGLMNGQYALYLLLFGLALVRAKPSEGVVFLLSLVVIYVSVHFLIEIQTRYRYFIMPFIIVFVGQGVMNVRHFLRTMIRQRS